MDFIEFEEIEIEPVEVRCSFEYLEEEAVVEPVDVQCNFEYLELEEGPKFFIPRGDDVICESCGTPNPYYADYCRMCQMELTKFRKLDLDVQKVKVKVVFPKRKNVKQCPVCGAFNQGNLMYCTQCTSALDG